MTKFTTSASASCTSLFVTGCLPFFDLARLGAGLHDTGAGGGRFLERVFSCTPSVGICARLHLFRVRTTASSTLLNWWLSSEFKYAIALGVRRHSSPSALRSYSCAVRLSVNGLAWNKSSPSVKYRLATIPELFATHRITYGWKCLTLVTTRLVTHVKAVSVAGGVAAFTTTLRPNLTGCACFCTSRYHWRGAVRFRFGQYLFPPFVSPRMLTSAMGSNNLLNM